MITPTPTQVKEPRRATFRTFFQHALGYLVAAGVVLPLVLAIVEEELGDVIPPKVMGWVVLVVGVAVAVSTAAARIMAIPQVEAFLQRHRVVSGLAASPARILGKAVASPQASAKEQPGGMCADDERKGR